MYVCASTSTSHLLRDNKLLQQEKHDGWVAEKMIFIFYFVGWRSIGHGEGGCEYARWRWSICRFLESERFSVFAYEGWSESQKYKTTTAIRKGERYGNEAKCVCGRLNFNEKRIASVTKDVAPLAGQVVISVFLISSHLDRRRYFCRTALRLWIIDFLLHPRFRKKAKTAPRATLFCRFSRVSAIHPRHHRDLLRWPCVGHLARVVFSPTHVCTYSWDGFMYEVALFVWIYEENPIRVFMYAWLFFGGKFLTAWPPPSPPTTPALDRNLNFRKFVPSRSGQFLKKVVFPLVLHVSSPFQRKMGGRAKSTLS